MTRSQLAHPNVELPSRKAHLEGRIAQILMGRADELLATPPDLRMVDLPAVK